MASIQYKIFRSLYTGPLSIYSITIGVVHDVRGAQGQWDLHDGDCAGGQPHGQAQASIETHRKKAQQGLAQKIMRINKVLDWTTYKINNKSLNNAL